MNRVRHGLLDVADAGAFLARLVRADPSAVVRLRPVAGDGQPRTALWGRLPWQALVTRTVRGTGPGEATVAAADLLTTLTEGEDILPARRDTDWRWPVPSGAGRVVERVTGDELVRVGQAAAGTLRAAAATRRAGERAVRDALLDHVAIVVTGAGADRLEVPQRLVQAVLKMGFLGSPPIVADHAVQVLDAGRWIGLAAPYGTAWLLRVNDFTVRPLPVHTNG